ncbi:two-component system sensor histidine kinase CreC [Cupriavidus taiwanensis]|uniref:two-component system sensor histidine kinase CreC n=1 Tax=Cupriavidus taiwanensis TaxID=164546 RepID=UPI000E102928|nr:two-component system sensor histidine kinase CreC [Cupriavidus taiwanensis]SOY54090.1 sensory histidine kinase [Cupriavidus taiwanensis]SOY54879.1 sensory histidine kinase [Cupriavidus taiwanensis]SOY87975.1 sensory histidine kinase [Cupriavidus taiwanensis]SOZ24646.1 sensory histidine kinase [Cupriavidus taiwanensis]SOZ61243.1 sensory histidine kinase [Cupriavidus taiwanensis]
MHIGLRIFFGFFLIVGLATVLTLRVFVQEVKPGVRQAMEDTLIDTAHVLAALAADDLKAGRIADGAFARQMAALREVPVNAEVSGLHKDSIGYRVYVTDASGIVRFDSTGTDVGRDYSRWNDVYLTLRGQYGARSTRADPADEASTVMHVAAPVRDGERIIGVLTVAKPNAAMAPFIARSQHKILLYGGLLIGTACVIGLACTLWLAHGLSRLRGYARAVAAGERAEMPLRGAGELAELGRAVQGMRERLEDKQYVEHYIHTLTHEMKSPLAAIGGAAELLQEEMPAADRQRFVANIRTQSGRLETMIRKLLALAEVEQRQRLEVREPVPLAPLLAQLCAELEPRARRRGVALQCDAGAGSGADSSHVAGDPFLLRQAIANLLDNAIDFAPPGTTVAVRLQRRGDALAIAVADQGPGIPDYALPRVFERFYSLPRPHGADKSTGLGLCFAREVATLHHGDVTLANRPGGGALAELVLPAA